MVVVVVVVVVVPVGGGGRGGVDGAVGWCGGRCRTVARSMRWCCAVTAGRGVDCLLARG